MAMQIIIIFLLLSLFSPFTTSSKLIDTVCNSQEGRQLLGKTYTMDCFGALDSNPKAKAARDYVTLAEVALGLGIENTSDSHNYILQLLNSNNTTPREKQALQSCASAFQASIASFTSAKKEVKEDPQSANYDVTVAADGAKTCEDAIKSNNVNIDSLVPKLYNLRLYSSIGSVVTDQLDG